MLPKFCGGCYADFYDFNESLTECVVLDNSGDLNDDGEINVIDIVLLVSNILDGIVNENGDINQDNLLNVVDVVLLVDMVLNQEIYLKQDCLLVNNIKKMSLHFFMI